MPRPLRPRIERPRAVGSFALIELLGVLAVAALVLGMGTVAYTRWQSGTAVSTAATLIADTLGEGRQDAIAQNRAIEVRFYDLAAAGANSPAYSALQLHALNPSGTPTPAGGFLSLPSGAVIDATSTYSTLIATAAQTPASDSTDARLTSDTRAFRFLPDGTTDLNPATNWFLTVRAASASDPAHFPSNWAAVRIDPGTGRAQVYRP